MAAQARTLVINAAKASMRRWFPKAAFNLSLKNTYWDEVELEILDLIVSRERAAIDVGANSGRYSFALSTLASHVYAIEPNPEMARLLSAGLSSDRVTIINGACSSANGVASLSMPTDRWGHGGESVASINNHFSGFTKTITVPTIMLDNFAHIDVGFIKMDVEGHELAALQGGTKLFERLRPTVLIECDEVDAELTSPTFKFLLSRGYEGYFIYKRQFYPLAELRPFMFDKSHIIGCSRPRKLTDYTNNFLFFPSMIDDNLRTSITRRLERAADH